MTLPAARSCLAAALVALPAIALAHPAAPGHAHTLAQGFVHPFTGLDHLAAMLAVGVWSARDPRRAWLAPAAFLACLLAGAIATTHGLGVAGVEPMIAFSLLAFGLLTANRATLAPFAAATLVGAFAWFHGAAHGLELGAGDALAGMLLATAALHVAGIGLGLLLQRVDARWERGAGLAVAVFGLSLLAA